MLRILGPASFGLCVVVNLVLVDLLVIQVFAATSSFPQIADVCKTGLSYFHEEKVQPVCALHARAEMLIDAKLNVSEKAPMRDEPAQPASARVALISRYAHAIAGAGGGLATVMLLHPFDTLKTRMQSDSASRSLGTFHTLRGILARDGFTTLYRGAIPALTGSMLSWSFYMHWFHASRKVIAACRTSGPSASTDFLAGTSAGLLTAFATNPIWVVKVRLQLQQQWRYSPGSHRAVNAAAGRETAYAGFVHGLYCIAREEGIRGWYRGIGPSLWLVSHGAIQFTLYERFKAMLARIDHDHVEDAVKVSRDRAHDCSEKKRSSLRETSVRDSLLASTASKLVASVMTYPLQLVRTRMQEFGASGGNYGGFISGFMRVVSTEGYRGLYRGLLPNVMRVMPQSAVVFVTYEQILKLCKYVSERELSFS